MANQEVAKIIAYLNDITEESAVPKNIRAKLGEVISILKDESNLSLKIHKVHQIFEEFNDDGNLDPFLRSQLWNVVPLLERL